jgi:hypothetical protein
MSDGVSTEAAVAGEAAAAAVEEVQSREAVVDMAVSASMTAGEAAELADTATTNAVMAVDTADGASMVAESAMEQTQQVAYLTADMLEGIRAENDAKMREMREYIDSRVPLHPPVEETTTEPEFEEVDANGPSVSDTGRAGESTAEDASESGQAGGSGAGPEKRYGLRHKRR